MHHVIVIFDDDDDDNQYYTLTYDHPHYGGLVRPEYLYSLYYHQGNTKLQGHEQLLQKVERAG